MAVIAFCPQCGHCEPRSEPIEAALQVLEAIRGTRCPGAPGSSCSGCRIGTVVVAPPGQRCMFARRCSMPVCPLERQGDEAEPRDRARRRFSRP